MGVTFNPLTGNLDFTGSSKHPYYQYIYRPFDTIQLGNVFNNWADMVDAIDGREGIIQFESNVTNDTIVLPTGTWTLPYQTWIGNGQNPDGGGLTIEFPEGCYIDSWINFHAQNGLNLHSTASHPIYTMTQPHIFTFNRAAIFTDNIEFIKVEAIGLIAIQCANGFGLYNDGSSYGNYEVFNVDSVDYGTVIVTTEQGVSPTIQDNTIRSDTNIVYGWLKQSSETRKDFATQANLAPFSVNFNGVPGGDGGAFFSNASVVSFEGQPDGISSTNVTDAFSEHTNIMVIQVVHGSDNTVARPADYAMVIWIGTVEPDNMAVNDLWIVA